MNFKNKKIIRRVLTAIIIALSFLLYFNSSSYVETHAWKYNGGYHLGDWIEFNENNNIMLKRRRIYFSNKEDGKVFFCMWRYLVIKANDGDLALYVNKGKLD